MKISIIGAGNMAHQLGNALHKVGHSVVEIYNRNYKRGENLAIKLNATPVRKIDDLDSKIDLLIIAVSDDAIGAVSRRLHVEKWNKITVVHTSGSVASTELDSRDSYGVFYPFQSMTMGQEIDFSQVPILVHSNLEKSAIMLEDLGKSISKEVHRVSDDQRGVIHVAGVFANNFTNHMVVLANGILAKNQLPSNILKPLIANTLQKILEMNPEAAQTGPAIRKDYKVMDRHLDFLSNQPSLHTIYKLISDSIIALDDSADQSST